VGSVGTDLIQKFVRSLLEVGIAVVRGERKSIFLVNEARRRASWFPSLPRCCAITEAKFLEHLIGRRLERHHSELEKYGGS
jgi:hypothetical protein